MNWSVSMSGRRPKGVAGSGGPPTWITQQLMLAPRMLLTVEWRATGLEKPGIPSVRRMRPVCVYVCVCVCGHVVLYHSMTIQHAYMQMCKACVCVCVRCLQSTFECIPRQQLYPQCSCLDHSLQAAVAMACSFLVREHYITSMCQACGKLLHNMHVPSMWQVIT